MIEELNQWINQYTNESRICYSIEVKELMDLLMNNLTNEWMNK